MSLIEATKLIRDAKITVAEGDQIIRQTASLAINRLQTAGVPGYVLSFFKRELRDWDIIKNEWRNK